MPQKKNIGRMYKSMDRGPYTYLFSKNKRLVWSQERKLKIHQQGNLQKWPDFQYRVQMKAKERGLIVESAVESARVATFRSLTRIMSRSAFGFKIVSRAHHLIRHHKLGTTAGADRLSSGMRKSFSPVYARGIRMEQGGILAQVRCDSLADTIRVKQLLRKKFGPRIPLKLSPSWSKI